MGHPPTPEQQHAIDLAVTGDSLVIEALAGTGKTSTLEMVADAMPRKNVQYVAFNKAIVAEAQGRMPGNVSCNTAHSLAMRAVGRKFSGRLNSGGRMRGDQIARELRIQPFVCEVLGTRKILAAGFLGSLVLRAIDQFCMTADPHPTGEHVPIPPGLDEPRVIETPDGPKMQNVRGPNYRLLQRELQPALTAAWADLSRTVGKLPFKHGHYLKIYQLSKPDIYADVILYDEAQDANPCMLDIINCQQGSQLIYVGDTYQQIYSWNGAVNALASAVPDAPRSHLTESFRFGEGVALYANKALEWLGASIELKGRGPESFVGPLTDELTDAILFRTNAKAVGTALRLLKDGRKPALVGGADDVVRFARAADELKEGGRTSHPELVCFSSWGEVQDYVGFDPNGSELRMLVDLIDEYGTDVIIAGLEQTVDEKRADVVLSTAHKAKGREWDRVKLAGDFPDPKERAMADEDVRLLYVSATRAKRMLDPTQVGFFDFQREEAV
jgi:hypothetical protein